MRRITLDLCRSAIFNRDQHSAGIGAIVRANGMDDFLHNLQIIKGSSTSVVIRDMLVLNATQMFRVFSHTWPGLAEFCGKRALATQIEPRS